MIDTYDFFTTFSGGMFAGIVLHNISLTYIFWLFFLGMLVENKYKIMNNNILTLKSCYKDKISLYRFKINSAFKKYSKTNDNLKQKNITIVNNHDEKCTLNTFKYMDIAQYNRHCSDIDTGDHEPISNEPASNEPTTNEPTTNEHTINEPTSNEPTTNELVTNKLVSNEPTLNEPISNEPTMNEPEINEPEMNEPIINEPEMNEPVINEPEMNEPIINEPEMNEPTMNEPMSLKHYSR